MQTKHTTPLADYGVVPGAPGQDDSALWRATFLGGVNAITLRFAERPEHRVIEALCERFDQTECRVTPPAVPQDGEPKPEVDEVTAMVLEDGSVRELGVTPDQITAVIAALGGLTQPSERLVDTDALHRLALTARAELDDLNGARDSITALLREAGYPLAPGVAA